MGSISNVAVNALGTLSLVRPAADLFDGTTTTIFNVSGKCAIRAFVMEVKDGALDATTNNVKVQANPTTGTTTDLCANLDTASHEEGTIYALGAGNITAALGFGSSGAVIGQTRPIFINAGTIDLVSSGDNAVTNSATIEVVIFWDPVEPGAEITIA